MHHRSHRSTIESTSLDSLLIVAGTIGGTAILGSTVTGQPVGWWGGLGFALFFLWQFVVPRDFRGPVGAPQLQRVVSSSEHLFSEGRARS